MTVTEFAEALYEVCEADGSTAFLDQVDAKARAAILAGNGAVGTVTSGSANGKSFTIALTLSPGDTLLACARARGLYNGTSSPQVTLPDWSRTLGGVR